MSRKTDTSSGRLHSLEGKLDWSYLKSGEEMKVPAGKAYITKHPLYYLKSQFFEPGRMVGPIFFAETYIEDPRVAVEESFSSTDYLIAPALALVVGAILFGLTIFSDEDTSRSTIILMSSLTSLSAVIGLVCLVKNGPALLNGGSHLIDFMKRRKVILSEPPASIDINCVSECNHNNSAS